MRERVGGRKQFGLSKRPNATAARAKCRRRRRAMLAGLQIVAIRAPCARLSGAREARTEDGASELDAFLDSQPQNFALLEDLALTNMSLGDKAAAFEMCQRAEEASPTTTDAMYGPFAVEVVARVAAGLNEPDRALEALKKLQSVPYRGPLVW